MSPRLSLVALLLMSLLHSIGQNTYVPPEAGTRAALDKATADTSRARLLMDLAMACVYRPGSEPTDLDSAQLLIGQADRINTPLHDRYLQGRSCFVHSNIFREKGDITHGIDYARQAIQLFTNTPYLLEWGESCIELAQYYSINTTSDLENKRKNWQEAQTQFHAGGLKEREAYSLKNLADLDYLIDNYGQAHVELEQALSIYTSLHYPATQGIYDLMGTISYCLGDYLQAVKYGLEAVKVSEAVHDTSMQLCTICHRLASAYAAWSKEKEARFYRQKALDIALKYKDHRAVYTVFTDPADLASLEHHWEETIHLIDDIRRSFPPQDIEDTIILYSSYTQAWSAGKKFTLAKKYADYLTGINERHKGDYDNVPLQPTLHCLVLYAASAKLYPQLEIFVDEYIKACRAIVFPGGLPWAYMMKSRADSGMGNYLAALRSYQLSKKMSDSVFNVTKSMQLSQMQVQYETEKKDQNIQLLANKSQLQELSLKKASLTRNIIIGAALLALVLLILAYRAYKIKQRDNGQLQKLADEKEWLVREIHHRVKNNLQIIISLLNTQAGFLDNPSAFSAIQDSRQRMQAIALIHQKLYRPDQDTLIDMASYIGEMIEHLKDSFINADKIYFKVEVGKIELDVSQAVPLGLIINETITNAVKHAFPDARKGRVTISLQAASPRTQTISPRTQTASPRTQPISPRTQTASPRTQTASPQAQAASPQDIVLDIRDDGPGFPEGALIDESDSMGIQLIKLFSEQLEGQLNFHIGPAGAGIVLHFKRTKI